MPLTASQLEVLGYIAQGYDNFQIGRILNRSMCTIKAHVQNIHMRMEARSRQHAVYMAMQQGILSCPNPEHPRCGQVVPDIVPLVRREVVKDLEAAMDMPIEWLKSGDIEINLEMFSLRIRDQTVHVGRHSIQLLIYLLKHPGKVFSRQHLLDVIYGVDIAVEERSVDIHVRRLRSVLVKHGYGSLVRTIRGVGYGVIELPGKAS